MAERKIKPSDFLLSIDPANGTTFGLVVCLNNHEYTQSKSKIDAKSMCGPDNSEGQPEYGLTFDGQVLLGPTSPKVSFAALQALFTSNAEFSWKLARVTPITDDINFTGKAALLSLNITSSDSEVTQFSAELSIHGTPAFTVTA